MIVVAILGILAAVAVPIFMSYIRDTKVGEAYVNLRVIGDGALVYYHEEQYGSDGLTVTSRVFPDSEGSALCSEGNAGDGSKVQPSLTNWDLKIWRDLKFSISKPHYFMYCYRSSDENLSFSTWADASLDGNGATDVRVCLKGRRQSANGDAIVSGRPFELSPSTDCAPENP